MAGAVRGLVRSVEFHAPRWLRLARGWRGFQINTEETMIAKTKEIARKLIPAVTYIRMSSDKQDKSPEQQRDELAKLAEKSGYRIIRSYDDLGVSGNKIEKRVGFRRMVADASKLGDFRVILCWDFKRFGRFNSIESGKWIHPLIEADVKLVTVCEGEINWSSFEGRVMSALYAESANQFLVDLSRTSLRGRISRAKAGHHNGGIAPYGYDRMLCDEAGNQRMRVKRGESVAKPKSWTTCLVLSENTQQVETVRFIFDRFANHRTSASAIANELNLRGVKTLSGCPWSRQVVKEILEQPAYCGDQVWGRRHDGKYHVAHAGEIVPKAEIVAARNGEKPRHHRLNAAEPIVNKDRIPPIVDRKIWAKAQARIAKSKETHSFVRGTGKYPLSGLVYCANCGVKMIGHTQRVRRANGREDLYANYCCTSYHMAGKSVCSHNYVPCESLLDLVVGELQRHFLSDEAMARLKAELTRQAAAKVDGNPALVKQLEKQISALNAKITRGTENLLLADPADVPAARDLLAKWRDEKAALEAEYATLARSPAGKGQDAATRAKAALKELERLRDDLASDDPALVKEVFSQLVDRIDLWFTTSESKSRKDRPAKKPRTLSKFSRGLLRLKQPFFVSLLSECRP